MTMTVVPAPLPHNDVRVIESPAGRFAQHVRMGPHLIEADEPVQQGGTDTGANPYELLLAALGSCTSMTLRMYADLKKIPLRRVAVDLRHSKVHVEDCAECPEHETKLDQIERVITLEGELSDEQRSRLLEIADKCPVHRTLTSQIRIVSRLA